MKPEVKATHTQLDLFKIIKQDAQAKRIHGQPDSMLAVYKDRFTYTFILEGEVASIHFDAGKQKIFFKGSHIANIELTDSQRQSLLDLRAILEADERGAELLGAYEATLESYMADK